MLHYPTCSLQGGWGGEDCAHLGQRDPTLIHALHVPRHGQRPVVVLPEGGGGGGGYRDPVPGPAHRGAAPRPPGAVQQGWSVWMEEPGLGLNNDLQLRKVPLA